MKRVAKEQNLIGKDEMNLADFAIGLIDSGTDQKIIERSQVIKTAESRLEQSWLVTGSAKWGLPQPSDDDILLALLYIASEDKFRSQTVPFSRYGLCKIMGWPKCGQNYERVEDGLRRLSTVKIEAKQSFYDGQSKKYVSRVFGLLDTYALVECSKLEKIDRSSASFSDVLWNSLKVENLKKIDLRIYYSLRSPIAKRLYRFLDKRRAKKSTFDLEMESLASMNLGISSESRRYPSQLKQTLDRAHKELAKIGFLKSHTYFKGSNGNWRVRYIFGKENDCSIVSEQIKAPVDVLPVPENTPREEEMLLIQRGVAGKRAHELACQKPDRIHDLVDFFDFLQKEQPGYLVNPVGWLIRAIEDEYTIPLDFPGYCPPAQRKQIQQDKELALKRRRKVEQQEAQKQEEIRQSVHKISELPSEEFLRLATLTRSRHSWLHRIPDDHPAFKAAVLDAWRMEKGELVS